MKTGPDTFRSGVVKGHRPNMTRLTFAYVNPQGELCGVIDAPDIQDAWIIATGWEDQAGIEQRKRQGWKVVPCMVEWSA
jgi:hypothetical protein